MKALSVKQPWAELIASGRKTIETRTWRTKYRGPLLICASKNIDNRACSYHGFVPNRMEAGFAVAIVDLVNCRPMVLADRPDAMCELNKYAWVLENVRRIKQFPVKGQLGVFGVWLLPRWIQYTQKTPIE